MSRNLFICGIILLLPSKAFPAVADLSVTKTASASSITAGSPLTYTLLVHNAGPDDAQNVTLVDLVPAVASIDSIASDFGTCTPSAETVTCHLDVLTNGGTASLVLTVIPTSTGPLCNFAKVASDATDLNYSNNKASVCTTVNKAISGADLSVSQMVMPDPIQPGENLTYTIRVHNNGPQAAENVLLTDTLPTNTTFVSASADGANNDGVVTWPIPKLNKNGTVTKTVVVSSSSTGQVCNAASVSGGSVEARNENNTSTLCSETQTAAPAVHDLAVVKITAPPTVVLTEKKPSVTKTASVQIQNRSPSAETINSLDGLVTLSVESLGLCPDIVPSLRNKPPQKKLPITLKPKQTLNVYFDVAFNTNCVNDHLKSSKNNPGHEDYRYRAVVHHEAIDGLADTHPSDDFGPRSVQAPSELEPNPDGKIQDRGVGKLKSDHTFGADVLTDIVAPFDTAINSLTNTQPAATNHAPRATDDTAFTVTTTPVNIPVLANDTDPDSDALSVTDFSQPANGINTFSNNVATYTANGGFLGTNLFSYIISDGHGGSATGRVTVVILAAPNHPPSAADDFASTTGTTPVNISVLANDTDQDGDALALIGVTQPPNGLVTLTNNLARYTASQGFSGTNFFNYTITDGHGGSATGHVTVTVLAPPNRPPIASNDLVFTSSTNHVQIVVLANDSDPDGDSLTVTNFTQPANGSVTFATNVATYIANTNFAGTNTFQYTISDGRGGSNAATVTVIVTNPPAPPPIWETSEIGAVWSDNFNRATLGTNWIVLGSANASIVSNELVFSHTTSSNSRQVYYDPWQICSDAWTIRWSERFGDTNSRGVGVGIKNFQAAGGNDRGYNGFFLGSGLNAGRMQMQRFDGTSQAFVAIGNAISLAPGQVIDCSLTRSGWTMTATASNRANSQVSTCTTNFSDAANLIAPTISRVCFYPSSGTVNVDNVSFTINHRKPARFIIVGASISDGYNASTFAHTYASIIQSNFTETVCNDSSSYNSTSNSVSVLPEILAHQPGTAVLMIGGNDMLFGYPPSQWQSQYSNLVAQLQLNSVIVKHCLNTPRTNLDLRPLNNWILSTYPTNDVIDTWTPLLQGAYMLNPAYDTDGTHPNDAGHSIIGTTIANKLH